MKLTKTLLLIFATILLASVCVFGTLAYLTSQDTVVNTFTVGQVDITLDEAKVTPDGKLDGDARVKANNYHLVPGMTYIKDPTMTVVKNSEEAYVRMMVTVNCLQELEAALAATGADIAAIFDGLDDATWICAKESRDTAANTITYEFRYKETVKPAADTDLVLDALFDSITVPGAFGADDMKSIAELSITVIGHAIQAAGFADADEAWGAFAK